MYTTIDFATKKELKEAVARGDVVTVYQPGPFSLPDVPDGAVSLEGPHFPKPHKWYARAEVLGGKVVSVR